MTCAFTRNAFVGNLFILLLAMAACGGTPPVTTTPEPAIAASTPAPVATVTPLPPTDTPAPTATPEPTSSPEPTATPALGQMNDENQWWDGAGWQALPEGEGWQLNVAEDGTVTAMDANGVKHTWENGGWVLELPQWNFEEHGKLPSLTQENASIEVVDGSIKLTFRVDNERSRLNGQEFTLTIPENQGPMSDGTFLTLTGEMVDTTLVVDPLRESAARGLEFVPGIKRVTADGTILAQYDTAAGMWRNTYETIEEGLGQQEVQPWMPQELGFLGSSDISGITYFVGRPDRLFHWNLFAPNNTYAKQVTLVELDMGEELSDIYVPLFEDMSTHAEWIFAVGSEFGVDVSQHPLALLSTGRDLPPKPVNAVVELVKQSPRIYISNSILDPVYYESARGGDMLYVRSDWAIKRPNDIWRNFILRDNDLYKRGYEFAYEAVQFGTSDVSGVLIGASDIGLFVNEPISIR